MAYERSIDGWNRIHVNRVRMRLVTGFTGRLYIVKYRIVSVYMFSIFFFFLKKRENGKALEVSVLSAGFTSRVESRVDCLPAPVKTSDESTNTKEKEENRTRNTKEKKRRERERWWSQEDEDGGQERKEQVIHVPCVPFES